MPDFNEILTWVKDNYVHYGYFIILIGAYLENTIFMGLVFPGGILLVLGGVFAAQGVISLPLALLLGWIGMFLGTSTDYWIGRAGIWRAIEKTRLRKWLEPGLKEAQILLYEKGGIAIFLAHFMGQIRTFVAVTAGIVKMPFRKFASVELFAALLWNIIYIGSGYLIGDSLNSIENFFKVAGVMAMLMAGGAYLIWKKRKKKQLAHEIAQLEQKLIEQNKSTSGFVFSQNSTRDDSL